MLRFTDFLSGGEQGLWGHLLAAGGEEVDALGSLAWAVGAPALGPGLLGTVRERGSAPASAHSEPAAPPQPAAAPAQTPADRAHGPGTRAWGGKDTAVEGGSRKRHTEQGPTPSLHVTTSSAL